MKKVLLGLVIALMMTGSVYAGSSRLSSDLCEWLYVQTEKEIGDLYILEKEGHNKNSGIYTMTMKHAKNHSQVWSNMCGS